MSVFKRGTKYWVGFRFNRQRHRYVSPENTLAGAKVYESVLRQKLAKGEPIIIKDKKEDMFIFKDFSQKWFEVYVKTNNKYSEVMNKRSILNAHLDPFFGNDYLDKINGLKIESFKAQKIKEGLANKSINNFLIVLSRCLKTAQEWGVLDNIPRIKLLKVQPQKFDYLTENESYLLLDNSDGLLRDMILFALKTGLRFGELTALDWSDIDFTNNLITVRRSFSRGVLGGTKSNKIRYIPFFNEISEMLKMRLRKTGYVFSEANNQPLISMTCLRWLHSVCKKVGMRKIGWHALRHTFASNLAQNGVSITLVRELLGHSDIRTTMRYSHLSPLATREAILSLNKNSGHNMATISNLGEEKRLTFSPIEIEEIAFTQ